MSKLRVLSTHVRIELPNVVPIREFLENTLGMEPLRALNRPQQPSIGWYPGLELSEANSEVPSGIRHIAWEVEDIDEVVRLLRAKGVAFETDEPRQIDSKYLSNQNEVVRFIFFETPMGF